MFEPSKRGVKIDLAKIVSFPKTLPSLYDPRSERPVDKDLASKLLLNGQQETIKVVPNPDEKGHWYVFSGTRRTKALKSNVAAGKTAAAEFALADVYDLDIYADAKAIRQLALSANVDRSDDSIDETIQSVSAFAAAFGTAEAAKAHGVTQQTIRNYQNLGDENVTAPDVLEAVRDGIFSVTAATQLIGVKLKDQIARVAKARAAFAALNNGASSAKEVKEKIVKAAVAKAEAKGKDVEAAATKANKKAEKAVKKVTVAAVSDRPSVQAKAKQPTGAINVKALIAGLGDLPKAPKAITNLAELVSGNIDSETFVALEPWAAEHFAG